MAKRSKKGCLYASIVWIIIIGILSVAAKFYILPYFQKELEDETSSSAKYENEIVIAADTFSGYCVLRSSEMKEELKEQGIRLRIEDDGADYQARMENLKNHKTNMAVFTVDSFIVSGAKLGEFPATIVMVIDETKGADALVSYKSVVNNLEDLDSAEAGIVLTPQSPSEFLSRTVIAHFNLPNLPEKWWIEADGASDVYNKFKNSDKSKKYAYALWEPYVSKALELPDAHLLLDSSKLKGYIVDILVAERKFLRDNPDLVKKVMEAYLRAAYSYNQKQDGMKSLVMNDAGETGSESLSGDQAEKLVRGIEWKNTLENYVYFGLLSDQKSKMNMLHMEDIIINIMDVLLKTDAIPKDPVEGKYNTLYYDKTLKEIQASNFHPGRKINLIKDAGIADPEFEKIRTGVKLLELKDDDWNKLIPVGKMRVDPISFARGTSRLHIQSERNLNNLAKHLEAWSQYYLIVSGHSRAEGDAEANLKLAQARADTVADYLISKGVDKIRINAKADTPSEGGGELQSVSFVLGQMPY